MKSDDRAPYRHSKEKQSPTYAKRHDLIRDKDGLWSYMVLCDEGSVGGSRVSNEHNVEERIERLLLLLNATSNIPTKKLREIADEIQRRSDSV